MYQNVRAVVNNHQSSWSQVPGIVEVINQFDPLLVDLNNKLKAQSALTKGIKLKKDDFFHEFIGRMSDLKKGLYLLAVQTNDPELRERNKESRSVLRSISADRLLVLTNVLLEDLDVYGNSLLNSGIGTEIIQQFRDQAVLFEERKNSTRQAIIDRSIQTKMISELEKQLNTLLIGQLDHYISLLSTTDANFFAEYKAARKIVGKGGGSKSNLPVV